MMTQPLGNGFAQSAAHEWEEMHKPRPCDRCAKVKPCEDFATPRICDKCITDHVEDQARELRNYRAKLRNIGQWARKALAVVGSERVDLERILREAFPQTEASAEIDERFEEAVMDRIEYRRSLGLPNYYLDEKIPCPRCGVERGREQPDGCRDPECPTDMPWPTAQSPYREGCPTCEEIRTKYKGFGPRHDGSPHCESGSIASGGQNAHCSCDFCF